MALPMRLNSTWRSRVSSRSRALGRLSSILMIKFKSLREILSAKTVSSSRKRLWGLILVYSRMILPASTLERSRMSLIRRKSERPEASMEWRYFFSCSFLRHFCSKVEKPRMAFMGVLISWLIAARKSDFVLVAFSAFCF